MISTLLKYHNVSSVKMRYKLMKDFAHFDVDRGVLHISTKYRTIKKRQIKEFLITMIHEIKHAMDSKKYGWKKFKLMWETEANKIEQGFYPDKSDGYWDNKYEIEAEEFGQKNYKKWYNTFKKQELF